MTQADGVLYHQSQPALALARSIEWKCVGSVGMTRMLAASGVLPR